MIAINEKIFDFQKSLGLGFQFISVYDLGYKVDTN